MLPFVFEDGFGYERYVDYMLDVPMYFVYRDGKYIDAAGQSFRDFLNGKLPALPGELPTLDDWNDHLSTAFPEVRLKTLPRDARRRWRAVEPHLRAAGAVGRPALRPDARSMRRGIWSRTGRSRSARRCAMRCPSSGLDAPIAGGGTLRDIAGEVLDIAAAGPVRRARASTARATTKPASSNRCARSSRTGKVPAERLLDRYHGEWGGDVSQVYDERASRRLTRHAVYAAFTRRGYTPEAAP